ncbi:MAG: heme-binding protein [Alphaproteobacteria bacterium]
MKTKPCLTLADAKTIAAASEAEARKNGWNVVISVLDDGGHLVFLQRMDGVQLGSVEVSQAKGRTALLFKRPTKAIEDAVAGGRATMMTLPGATPIEGGVPIVWQGEVVGAVGVSGVQSHEDAQIARAGAEAVGKA